MSAVATMNLNGQIRLLAKRMMDIGEHLENVG